MNNTGKDLLRAILLVASLLQLSTTMVIAQTTAGTAEVAVPAGVEEPAIISSTADHSKFKELDVNFKSGPEVTKACLECHTEAAKQVHNTKHWTWEFINPETKQRLGKKNVINNFCTATSSNQGFCSACHVGYGWKDDQFDFTEESAVDCLVCHDTTGKYKKLPGLAGHPNYQTMEWPPKSGKFREPTDLTKIAKNIGKTSRQSCGACHFYGGGGNAVKHGDLDSSLNNPKRYLDIHMESDGLNFTCGKCHQSNSHEVSGSRYAPTATDQEGVLIRGDNSDRNPTTCRACHGNAPHKTMEQAERLNHHSDKVACQTCHIPEYARGPLATKMTWDWSTAGKLTEDGKRLQVRGSHGRVIYDSKKGDFTYDRYVIPEYVWFNGNVKYTLFGDKVDGQNKVKINEFLGGPDDPRSRIWPVKRFTGKQPYDVGNQTLAVVHTAGKSDAAYWNSYDWEKAMEAGMASVGVKYSGQMDFVETEMSWPITHMVAPREDALTCAQCHNEKGRLQNISGVYMPGRDNTPVIDKIGWIIALLTLIGVVAHGGIRIVMHQRRH